MTTQIKNKLTGQVGATTYRAKKYAAVAMKALQAIHGDVFELVTEQRDHRYGYQPTPSQLGWDRINKVRRAYR